MKNIRLITLAIVAGVTLGSVALEQAFTTLLFERNTTQLADDVLFTLPLLLVLLAVILWRIFRFSEPLNWFVKNPDTVDKEGRLALRVLLSQFPKIFIQSNIVLFFIVPALSLGLKVLFGHPIPSLLDLALVLALNVAFGFLASLQEQSTLESRTIPIRVKLGLTQVEGTSRDASLKVRLFLVNLASVLLSGLLAGMAALGFYREVVAYYTSLSADALTSASTVSAQAISDNEVKVVFQLALLFLAVLAWTLWLTTTALRNVSRQLKTLEERMHEMADGAADLGRRAEVVFFDEVGLLTGRINAVMERMQGVVTAIQTASTHVLSSTNRVRSIALESEQRLGQVESSKASATQALEGQAEALAASLDVAQSLEKTALEVKDSIAAQTQSVTLGATAMEQMATSVREVRDLTIKADGLASSLRQTSEQGGRSVEAVRLSMESIQSAAQAVAGTVAIIKKTASQTNLLAMNAAIEAAHAGSSGLGFAVVAGEVRTLAEDSSQGAKKVADMMREMTGRITEGDRLAREAGEAFARIYELIIQTSEVMSTVSKAMEEQQAGTNTLLTSTRTLREASDRIGSITERQSDFAAQINRSVTQLLEAGAVMSMAQDVQSRATTELSELVRTIAKETQANLHVADELGQTVAGFTVK